MKEKERAGDRAGAGGPLQQSGTKAKQSKALRPPDLCRKQKERVVIMWWITMCRSGTFQSDFDMSVRKRDQIQTLWVLHAEMSLQSLSDYRK